MLFSLYAKSDAVNIEHNFIFVFAGDNPR